MEPWESAAANPNNWRLVVGSGMKKAKERTEKRERCRERPSTTTTPHQIVYTCTICNLETNCKSKIGFFVSSDDVRNAVVVCVRVCMYVLCLKNYNVNAKHCKSVKHVYQCTTTNNRNETRL